MPRVMYAWPNPAISEINISIPSPGGEIRIYDIMGHLMMTTELMEGIYNPSVTIESLASGTDFLVWHKEEMVERCTFVKI